MKPRQLTLGGRSEAGRRGTGGPTTKRAKRFHLDDCPLCKKYYADWMREMNTYKHAMLRRIHRGAHLHGDSNDSQNSTTPKDMG